MGRNALQEIGWIPNAPPAGSTIIDVNVHLLVKTPYPIGTALVPAGAANNYPAEDILYILDYRDFNKTLKCVATKKNLVQGIGENPENYQFIGTLDVDSEGYLKFDFTGQYQSLKEYLDAGNVLS